MDTEIYEEKPKNNFSLEQLAKFEPIIKIIIRVILSLLIWVATFIIASAVWGILAISGSAIPALLFFVPIIIVGFLTFIIWNDEVYERIKAEIMAKIKGNISEQIAEKFKELKPEEIEEIREGMAKLKKATGIDIQLPQEKRKRDRIDAAIRKLSDSQLIDLKQGLNNGSIDEDDLFDWLSEQED
jgi:ABC-type transport system involved in cytochrome bd biosynthesis fused ATPase/permease subunit